MADGLNLDQRENGNANEELERDNENLEVNEGDSAQGQGHEGPGGGSDVQGTPPAPVPDPNIGQNPDHTLLRQNPHGIGEVVPPRREDHPPYYLKTAIVDSTLDSQLMPSTAQGAVPKKSRINWGATDPQTPKPHGNKWEGKEITVGALQGLEDPLLNPDQVRRPALPPAGYNQAAQPPHRPLGGTTGYSMATQPPHQPLGGTTGHSMAAQPQIQPQGGTPGNNTYHSDHPQGAPPPSFQHSGFQYSGIPPGYTPMPNQSYSYPGMWNGYPYMPQTCLLYTSDAADE